MSEPSSRETAAPAVEHGGLNVVDFPSQKILQAISKAVSLLPPQKRRLLFLAAGVQVSLGLLDLVGIALIGLVAAVAVTGVDSVTTSAANSPNLPSWADSILASLGLEEITFSQLTVVIALSAVGILVLKTVLSAIMSRRIIRFLAHRQADVSVRLAREFLRRPLIPRI